MTLVNRVALFFVIIVLLLCTIIDISSQSGVVRIRPSGGLNTIADDFSMPLEDARVAHNIDFSTNIGGLTVRKGYDSVSAIPTNWDSLVSIYGAYYSDGSQQLFAVADSAGVGYGNVIFGAKGSSSLTSPTVAIGYWSIQNKTKFAMVGNKVYAVNGQQNGFVWDGRSAQRWPLQAPGEPTICPLNTPGSLNGEYRYIIRPYAIFDSGSAIPLAKYQGTLAPPVVVSNGRILLTDLTFPMADSFASSPDSAHFYVYRTKANMSPVDAADTACRLPNIYLRSVGASMATFYENVSDTTPQSYFIDNTPDNQLTPDSSWTYVVHPYRVGRMKTGLNVGRFGLTGMRYGAPTYFSKVDSTNSASSRDSTHKTGLMYGLPTKQTIAGWAYTSTLVDTSNAIESDTTRSLFVLDSFTVDGPVMAKPFSITIGLPRVAPSVRNVMRNIYRAPVFILGHDSTWLDTVAVHITGTKDGQADYDEWVDMPVWKKRRVKDSVTASFYYLAKTVPVSDTIFVDDIRYDSLRLKETYRHKRPPLMNSLFSFENRLYGTSYSNLYFSFIDTVTRWGAFDFISVNRDDGDIITLAYPSRGVIRALKNRSNYNIFQDDTLAWNRTEVSGYFGCVAPNSHAATINGHYYVSDIGVIRETEGANLERTQSIENVSAKLKQFADLSVTDARRINAFAIPSEGKVLFCLDTTYVYDERTNTWATWDGITFSDATLYGAETQANFIPGDTMYFIKRGQRTLYRYGNTTQDVTWSYESAPFGMETPLSKQVKSIGVWANNLSAPYGIQATLKDETGVNVTTPPVDFGTAINGYTKYSFPNDYNSKSLYHRLRLNGLGTGTFRVFDIYQNELGETEEK